jgi:RNA polymerase sigma factor (sigma-70 family)
MEVDAGQHIPLIKRVIGQMGLRGDAADEAFSEGLVGLVEAAKSYDPARGPLAHWLAKCIRWKILNQRSSSSTSVPIETIPLIHNRSNYMEHRAELSELITKMQSALTELEYQIIVMGAMGYQGQEIAKQFNLHPVAISRAKKTARAKLEALR